MVKRISKMIIYPAIDLRGGKVVRLQQGDPNRQKIYSEDPIAAAQRWLDAGTDWLHVVNLDGAFQTANDNLAILEVLAALDVSVQFGGGIRSLEDAAQALDAGASRVVLGTAVVQNPDLVDEFVARWGAEQLTIALDARGGKVATHGWQQKSDWTPADLGRELARRGAVHTLYTDVARDGELEGVNVEATAQLAADTGLKVIASGGVASLGDVTALCESGLVEGAVLGKALYEGIIDLAEAIRLASDR
jgi:phosphoribosylformimino-5-aminoimidazole carboxamide ribotide isomerase